MELVFFGLIVITFLLICQIGGYFLFYFVIKHLGSGIDIIKINDTIAKLLPTKRWFIIIQFIALIIMIFLVALNSAYLFVYIGGFIASLSLGLSFLFGYYQGLVSIEENEISI